jgi:hypothetical protein
VVDGWWLVVGNLQYVVGSFGRAHSRPLFIHQWFADASASLPIGREILEMVPMQFLRN